MKLLLDTHAFLWWCGDDDRLGHSARELIADQQNDVFVSIVSLWEIVVKQRVGKLRADIGALAGAISLEGFERLDISLGHLETLVALPQHHRDPFDHLLIAQAIAENAAFVSDDRTTPLYSVRHIPC